MATADISAVGAPIVREPTTRRFQDLQSEDFFALLIAELQSQDPLKPTDNQQLLQQMSSIRQMEQSTNLNKTLEALAGEQRFGATSGLIGHYVAGTLTSQSGEAVEVQGLVIGVRFEQDGRAILELHNGNAMPADKVEQVTLVENLPPEIRERLQQELEQLNGGAEAATSQLAASRLKQLEGLYNPWERLGMQLDQTSRALRNLFAPRPPAAV